MPYFSDTEVPKEKAKAAPAKKGNTHIISL